MVEVANCSPQRNPNCWIVVIEAEVDAIHVDGIPSIALDDLLGVGFLGAAQKRFELLGTAGDGAKVGVDLAAQPATGGHHKVAVALLAKPIPNLFERG